MWCADRDRLQDEALKVHVCEDVLLWTWYSLESHKHFSKGDFEVEWTPCGFNPKKIVSKVLVKRNGCSKNVEFYIVQ